MSAALDRTFAALANAPRRAILVDLQGGPRTIGSLRERFDFTKQAMSKHVAQLESAGLVTRTKRGRTHELRLVPEPLDEIRTWIDQRTRAWEASFDRLADVLAEGDR